MTLAILGLGTAVPPTVVSRTEGQRIAERFSCRTPQQSAWLPHVYGGAGIDRRYFCVGADVINDALDGTKYSRSVFLPRGPDDDRGPTTGERMHVYREQAPTLARRAAALALSRSRLLSEQITHLVTVSCTGFYAPGFDVALIRDLGLPANTRRTHVGYMGCHGALNGLRVARAFADSEPDACVLLCAVELCSLHYHYGFEPQKLIANALFSDGAAALVGGAANVETDWQLVASGSCLIPDSEDAMAWTIGDHGFEMTLSKRVPGLIATHLRPWLAGWLAGQELRIDEITSWAIHPGGPRILDAAAESLGLPPVATAASREIFAAHGNMSSPTVLFILDRLREQRAPRPCVALGFGPGLCAEAALFV
jgi:predicted naringenin-chalcone synthase